MLIRLKTDGELPTALHASKQGKRKMCKDASYKLEYYDDGDVKDDEWDTYSDTELPPDVFYASYGMKTP